MGRNIVIYSGYDDSDYLAHHGVKGMKWGVRKHRDPNGKQRKGLSKKAKIAIGAGAAAATVAGGIVANHIIKKKTGGAYNLASMTRRGLSSVGRKLKRTPVHASEGSAAYDTFKYDKFEPDKFEPDRFEPKRYKVNHTKVNHTKVNYVKYDPNKFRYNKFRYNEFKI